MTTTIKISAHCSSDKEVQIDYEDCSGPQQKTIQDGEEFETVVYDGLSCTAKEIEKTQPELKNGDGQTRPPKEDPN